MNDPEAPQELPGWLEAAQMAGLGPLEIAAMAPHANDRSLAEVLKKERHILFGEQEKDTREEESHGRSV